MAVAVYIAAILDSREYYRTLIAPSAKYQQSQAVRRMCLSRGFEELAFSLMLVLWHLTSGSRGGSGFGFAFAIAFLLSRFLLDMAVISSILLAGDDCRSSCLEFLV